MTTPTQIGAYRILEQIGEGGMGTVYLAEHTLLGRRAAIKVLHPQFSVRQDIVERFFNEARATTSINDPGIVQVFDFGFQDGTAFIVMEHLVGETLLARMRRIRRMPEADLVRLARQIALSLHAAHARNVVHRDLKPDNIFIVPDPEAVGGERTKVLDFGIAKLVDNANAQHTQTGMVLGTPSYMSPEQCRGAGLVDHRSDIYSLGCVMFRCLTGHQLFEAQGSGDLIAMHLREPPRAPSTLVPTRPELDAIILRCLAKSPDDRYASMHDLAFDLDQLLRQISVPPGTNVAALTPLPPQPFTIPTGEVLSTPIPIVQNPTTLSSGISVRPAAASTRRWPVIAVVAMLLVGGGIATVIATTSQEATPAATPAPAAAQPAPPPPAPPPPVAVEPPAPPPPAPVERPVAVEPAQPAAVEPAQPAVAPPVEAAVAKKPPVKKPPIKKKKKDESLYDDR